MQFDRPAILIKMRMCVVRLHRRIAENNTLNVIYLPPEILVKHLAAIFTIESGVICPGMVWEGNRFILVLLDAPDKSVLFGKSTSYSAIGKRSRAISHWIGIICICAMLHDVPDNNPFVEADSEALVIAMHQVILLQLAGRCDLRVIIGGGDRAE